MAADTAGLLDALELPSAHLVGISMGGMIAQTIPGARLATMRGMGHDLPRGAWPALVNLIDDHIRAGAVRSADGQES